MSAESNLDSSLCLDFQVTASYCSDVYDEQMANQTLKEGVADKVLAVIQGTVRETLVQTDCASVLYIFIFMIFFISLVLAFLPW